MSWFHVSDMLHVDAKFAELQTMERGERAIALWLLGGSWCMRELTDGVITAHAVKRLGYGKREIRDLVTVGLWTEISNCEWRYAKWLKYQYSKVEVITHQAKEAAKKRAQRAAKGLSRPLGTDPGDGPGGRPGGVTPPILSYLSDQKRNRSS